jgi:hypothetical protein
MSRVPKSAPDFEGPFPSGLDDPRPPAGTVEYCYTVHAEEALNALIGRPAPCVWATTVTGHYVHVWRRRWGATWAEDQTTLWEKQTFGPEPEERARARAWGRGRCWRWTKDLTR